MHVLFIQYELAISYYLKRGHYRYNNRLVHNCSVVTHFTNEKEIENIHLMEAASL